MTDNKIQKKKSWQDLLLPFLFLICILEVFGMVTVLIRGSSFSKEAKSFTPPPFEEEARQGEPKVLEELGYSQLNAKEYEVALCGAPIVQDGKAFLYLTNPDSNKVWLKVRILDESGRILGESGLLKPGEYVEAVKLTAIPKEDTSVQLKIMSYEPETYYSAGAVSLSTTLQAQE